MFQLDLKSRKSIYEQIVDNMKELIVNGVLEPDEKLPSVRELAGMLTVNPNTIQKAYRELERQGYLYMVSGLGSFTASKEKRPVDQRQIDAAKRQLQEAVKELVYLEVPHDSIRAFVSEVLGERGYSK